MAESIPISNVIKITKDRSAYLREYEIKNKERINKRKNSRNVITREAERIFRENNPQILNEFKKCKTCSIDKTMDNFSINTRGKFTHHCRECTKIDNRKKAKKAREKARLNPLYRDKQNAYAKVYRDKMGPQKTRAAHIRHLYGLTPEMFNAILCAQGNCCAICKVKLDNSHKGLKPHIDHCHSTDKVRGILCGRCNTGIGMFLDKEDSLFSAIQYLAKYRDKT